MPVRAKFYVWTKDEVDDQWRIRLSAVTSGSKENEAFFKATPTGMLDMTVRKEAGDLFVVGQEYYLDFTPVPKIKSES